MGKVKDGAIMPNNVINQILNDQKQFRAAQQLALKSTPTEQMKLVEQDTKRKTKKEIEKSQEDNHLLVIDAGHGGTVDKEAFGSQHGSLVEKKINLNVAVKVKNILVKNNYQVLLTRTNDTALTRSSRCKIANKNDADLFISIHTNSAKPLFHGACIITPKTHDQSASFDLAYKIYMRMHQEGIVMTNDAIYEDHRELGILVLTKMPAIIVEIGYIWGDSDNLTKQSYLNKIAWSIAYGAMDYVCTYLNSD